MLPRLILGKENILKAENILYSRENAEMLVGRKLKDDEYYYDILENVKDKVEIENCDKIFAIGKNGVYTNGNRDYLSKDALKILSDEILRILENYEALEHDIKCENEKAYYGKCERMRL